MSYIAVVAAGDGFITCGADDRSIAKQIIRRLQMYLQDRVEPDTITSLEDFPYEDYGIPPTYLQCFQRPFRSANYHLKQGGSRWNGLSVIDWWTFLDEETRTEIMDLFYKEFIDGPKCGQVAERGDIPLAVEQQFPLVGQHGVDRLLKDRVWQYLKKHRREQLSAYSRRAITNGKNGKGLEEYFSRFCEETGLQCFKPSGRAFARYFPEAYRAVKNERGSLKGLPDFFVDKSNSHTLGDWMTSVGNREWEPSNRFAFVECKFNDSPLSKDQREVAEILTEAEIEVFLLRGTEEGYRFSQI